METETILIDDLNTKPANNNRDGLIERATRGVYNAAKTKTVSPLQMLHSDLSRAGYDDLAVKALDGTYGTP